MVHAPKTRVNKPPEQTGRIQSQDKQTPSNPRTLVTAKQVHPKSGRREYLPATQGTRCANSNTHRRGRRAPRTHTTPPGRRMVDGTTAQASTSARGRRRPASLGVSFVLHMRSVVNNQTHPRARLTVSLQQGTMKRTGIVQGRQIAQS